MTPTPRMGPLRDETLTHQVRLILVGNSTVVSCNCRRAPGKNDKAGKLNYDHIGKTHDFNETRKLYNNPENHWAPFGEEDKLS